MRLGRLDLNLLVALEALLRLRSVTAAAGQLHVSQPSMSGSLARLREHFADRLLLQVGRRMDLTPLGEALVDAVAEALQKVEAVVALRPGFDPAIEQRHFAISASEATVLTLITEVLRAVERQAPGVTVALLPTEPARMTQLLDRRDLDFVFVGENALLADHPRQLVASDDFVCVVWAGNRRVRRKLTMAHYLALDHAITRYGLEQRPGFEQYTLQQLGVQRRVTVSCTTPALLGPLVVGTQRIATLPSRLAQQQVGVLPLRIFPPPLPLPPLRLHLQWHRARERDGATQWFRELVVATARSLGY